MTGKRISLSEVALAACYFLCATGISRPSNMQLSVTFQHRTIVFINRGWVDSKATTWNRPEGTVTMTTIISEVETVSYAFVNCWRTDNTSELKYHFSHFDREIRSHQKMSPPQWNCFGWKMPHSDHAQNCLTWSSRKFSYLNNTVSSSTRDNYWLGTTFPWVRYNTAYAFTSPSRKRRHPSNQFPSSEKIAAFKQGTCRTNNSYGLRDNMVSSNDSSRHQRIRIYLLLSELTQGVSFI